MSKIFSSSKPKFNIVIENIDTLMEVIIKLKQNNESLKDTIIQAHSYVKDYTNNNDMATHAKIVLENTISTFKK